MAETKCAVLLITAPTAAEAQRLARKLLEERKAACVNILPGVDSLYWWQDKLESAHESLMIVKTRAALVPELVDLVKSLHSYTVPEVIALPIIGGNPEYLAWVEDEVR
ncbi:MAG: divalent-cation tolerance protein CutA [Chloroflexi bacterium]|nr:divalent-cation tolerance protein CutA [Chloroflexota bacterium]